MENIQELKIETPDILLNKKIKFGILTNYLRQYEKYNTEIANKYTSKEELQKYLKSPENYDLVFSIVLKELVSKSRKRTFGGKNWDVISMLDEELKEVKRNKNYVLFESSGVSNIEYNIEDMTKIKELKIHITTLSIIKVLKFTDKFYGYKNPKWNEDSLRRYFNIYDLIVLKNESIDTTNLNFSLLEIENNFTSDLFTTQER